MREATPSARKFPLIIPRLGLNHLHHQTRGRNVRFLSTGGSEMGFPPQLSFSWFFYAICAIGMSRFLVFKGMFCFISGYV